MDASATPAPPPAPQPPLRITSYQLIVSFHEDTYKREFPAESLPIYSERRVDRIYVARKGEQAPVPLQPPQEHRWRPQADGGSGAGGRGGPYDGPGVGSGGGGRGCSSRSSSRKWGGGFRGGDEIDDKHLVIHSSSCASYNVSLDRRLRPVVLAVHKTQDCPLPLLGLTQKCAGASSAADSGNGNSASERLRDRQPVLQMEQALQRTMAFIRAERLSAAVQDPWVGGNPSTPAALLTPPPPPLVIHANEGDWRDSRVIHLKLPVDAATEYLRLLRDLLDAQQLALDNHGNDTMALINVLQDHHVNMTARYSSPALLPIISNSTRLGDAAELLDSRPEMYFRVPDESGELSGGPALGAVWYGCVGLPQLMAALPGRSLNGLSLDEVLDCMAALWQSKLLWRLFQAPAGVKKAAGLVWTLVPCFAEVA